MVWLQQINKQIFQMGQFNGNTIQETSGDYFQQQIQLYRWRADPAHNAHIPRVRFCSKIALIKREKLHQLIQQQLSSLHYIDINSITQLARDRSYDSTEQVMTFETYVTTLSALQCTLTLEQTLLALQGLLTGYESILHRLQKLYISIDCCFVTDKGEVRAWINPNHTLNELPANICEVNEATAVNQVIRVCEQLSGDQAAFLHFNRQLMLFMDHDILHNICFSSVRKFINGYLYAHHLVLPNDLSRPLARLTPQSSGRNTCKRANSSLSELLEPSLPSIAYLPSTGAHLANPSLSQHFQSMPSGATNSSSESRGFEFYRPHQKVERKLSNLEVSQHFSKQCVNRSNRSNRSEIILKKSVQNSLSSSFSKKYEPIYQHNQTLTPKNPPRTRDRLQSTSGQSFLHHSKDPSGLTASRLLQSSSTANLLDTHNSYSRLQKKTNSRCMAFIEVDKSSRLKFETQAHSKQPSFDQNSSALFVSPAAEYAQRGFRSKINTVAESEQGEQDDDSYLGPVSTTNQVYPSQLLTREISGLVSNHELFMYESRGSFISMKNSSESEYHGQLLRLGRSAKMLAVPSSKRIEGHARGNLPARVGR